MKATKYVVFGMPGVEPITREVKNFDVNKLEIPDQTSEFQFFTILETEVKHNKKKVKLHSKPIFEKTLYFYGGTMHTVDQIENEFCDPRSAQKFRDNKITHVVRGRFGGLKPAKKSDKCIPVRTKEAKNVASPVPAAVTKPVDPNKATV